MSGARWDDNDDAPPAGGPAWGGGPVYGGPGDQGYGGAPAGGPAYGGQGAAAYGGPARGGGAPAGGPAWGAAASGAYAPTAPVPTYGGGFAPPGYTAGGESLGHSLAVRPPSRRRRGRVVAGVVAGVLVLGSAAGVGAYFARGLLGGGDQPEQHLPGTTVAMARLDLNPSAGQKLDAIRFARKFPSGKGLQENGDPRQWLWEQTTKQVTGAPSWAKAQKWLGDRAAVAIVPDATDAATPLTVVVLSVSDEKQAAADMGSVKDAGVATKDGWLYLSDTAAHAAAVATGAAASPLSDKPMFTADLKRLGEDGIATAWFDGAGLSGLTKGLGGGQVVDGHGAVALRFSGTDLELVGSTAGSSAAGQLPAGGTGVDELPTSTLAAVGVSGLGPALTKNWSKVADAFAGSTGQSAADLQAQAGDLLGLRLPADLAVLLGTRTVLAVGEPDGLGTPTVGLRVTTDPAKAGPVVRRLTTAVTDGLPVELTTKSFAGGYTLSNDPALATALAASDGGLGKDPKFTAAVPDAASASVVAYADVAGLVAAYGDAIPAGDKESLAVLKSFGLSVVSSAGGVQTFRVRLTTR